MMINTGTNTDVDMATREVYIDKLQGAAAAYARLFIKNPWLKDNQKAYQECQKIGGLIRILRFSKKMPDTGRLEAAIKEAETEAACLEAFYV